MKNTILVLTLMILAACAPQKGKDGLVGPKGDQGDVGAPGQSCSVANAIDGSGALITCGSTTAFISNGTDGVDGTNGLNGIDATPVVMVKLCPGVTGSYASGNFPEMAFKIGTKLYGVYSANGKASLAEFYPGAYTTTAPGQNCSVVINADGSLN